MKIETTPKRHFSPGYQTSKRLTTRCWGEWRPRGLRYMAGEGTTVRPALEGGLATPI